MSESALGALGVCVIAGVLLLVISITSHLRVRQWKALPDSVVEAMVPRPKNVLVVEVPGETGTFVDLGFSEESSETLSAEPTLVSKGVELRVPDGGEHVAVAEGSKLKIEKIIGARREAVGPAVTAEGGKLVRRYGFEVAAGTRLWLQAGRPNAKSSDAAGPYRESARAIEGECLLSGVSIIEKTWVDPRKEGPGCSMGCALPFVAVFIGTAVSAAFAAADWWPWVAAVAIIGGAFVGSILQNAKPP